MDDKKRVLRVFIAEDEAINLLGFKKMIIASGHKVVGTAMDGKTAVEECLRLKPDIMLMDVNMPEMDGMTAIEEINKVVKITAIIITGYKDDGVLERADEAQVFGYLQKPVDEMEIKGMLKLAAGRYGELQEAEKKRDEAVQNLQNRKLVERAKGIMQRRFGLDEEAAMKALTKKARNENKKLEIVAQDIIAADKLL